GAMGGGERGGVVWCGESSWRDRLVQLGWGGRVAVSGRKQPEKGGENPPGQPPSAAQGGRRDLVNGRQRGRKTPPTRRQETASFLGKTINKLAGKGGDFRNAEIGVYQNGQIVYGTEGRL